ncbi:hypothetical protein BLOT_004458 [Blomia tropicalis]|nr:hypothetical protein BLOT_004458 [Blomia tropicalis]
MNDRMPYNILFLSHNNNISSSKGGPTISKRVGHGKCQTVGHLQQSWLNSSQFNVSTQFDLYH